MEGLGAERHRIVAVLGPTISAKAYEVGPGIRSRLVELDGDNAGFLRPLEREGTRISTCPAISCNASAEPEVGQVHDLALCTYSDEDKILLLPAHDLIAASPDYGRC
jgi:copper oxidase (laccase) domain-containing protein